MRTRLFYALSALVMVAMVLVTSCKKGDDGSSQDQVPALKYEVVLDAQSVDGVYYLTSKGSGIANTIDFTVDGYFTVLGAELTESKVEAQALDITEESNEDGSTTYGITIPSGIKGGTIAILGSLSNGEKARELINFEIKEKITTSDKTTGTEISKDIDDAMDEIATEGGSLAYIPKDETAAQEPIEIEMPVTEAGKDVEVDLTTQKGSVDLTVPADTKGGVTVKATATEEAVTVNLPEAGSEKKDITVDAPKAKSITVEATSSTEAIEVKVPAQSASEVVINAPESTEVKFSAPAATEPITIKTNSNAAAETLVIDAPNTTVTLVKPDGSEITYTGVNAATADNTFIIGNGVTVDGLTISKGNVEVYGTLTGIVKRSESNPDMETIIYLHNDATFDPSGDSKLTNIKQLVKDANLAKISIDLKAKDVEKEAGSFTINLTSNYQWKANNVPSWITFEPASGAGDQSIEVTYEANTEDVKRVGNITFTAGDADPVPFTLTQALCPVSVTAVTLNKTALSLEEEKAETLTATVKPTNATNKGVTWDSSNESVATVKDGKVTAIKAGETTITVTTEDGEKKATCKVTVTPKPILVTEVTLNETTLSLEEEESATLTATVKPDDATNKGVTWDSSNKSVATVKDGKVTAIKAGETTITVTTEDGEKKATCKVTVTAKPILVTGVTLNKSNLSLAEGEEETLTATVKPTNATNKGVTWDSSNESVATVENGKVTAIKAGTTTITVTTEDGEKTATCLVKVQIDSETVTPPSITGGEL